MARTDWLKFVAPLALLAASAAGAQDAGPQPDGRYMVKFRDFNGAAQTVSAAGGRVAHELEPQSTIAAYLPEQALHGLRNNPNVAYVEVDPRRYLMGQSTPYGIDMVQASDTLLAGSNTQSNVTVCIIDSGYYQAHEDLKDNAYVTGTNDSGTGNWSEDSCGHGTHVAGTIAAVNNSVGVVGVNGNKQLRLHIEKVFNGADCKWSYSSTLIAALNRCRDAVKNTDQKLVVSMSLGGSLSSTTENSAFQSAYDAGALSVAAAGNDGSTRKSYPASYASVISVAAVDGSKTVASFSQKNDAVELAAPGVGVVSTTPFKSSSLNVAGNTWLGANIDGSARSDVTAVMVDGGLCGSAGAWSGNIVLCERGTYSFAEKVTAVKNGGGVGAVIYNNVAGGFAGTLNGTSTISAISISREDGLAARAHFGSSATLVNTGGIGSGYESYDGTSMATPHVSGVAALVWSRHTGKTNAQVRDALQKTAEDRGTAGRDTSYGYGIVRARAADDYLAAGGGTPPPASIALTVAKGKTGGKNFADLKWSGATTLDVNINRNSSLLATPGNTGTFRDLAPLKGSNTYQVCNTGDNPVCSNKVTVRF